MINSRFLALVSCFYLVGTNLFAGINVSEDLVHEYTLEKGARISGQVTVTNMGVEESMVKIEICDYLTGFNGQVKFDPPNSHERSLAPWLGVGVTSFLLAPGEQRIIPYEISFTEEEKKAGSYWSALLISPEPRYKPTTQGMGLATIVRYAVIILGNLHGDAEPSIKIPEYGIEESLDSRFGWFHIENDGDTVLRPKIVLELISQDGEVVFVTPPSPDGFLFPFSSSRVRFNITDAPVGEFTGLLTVDAGGDYVFGAQYPFNIQSFNPYLVEDILVDEEQLEDELIEMDTMELTEHVRVTPLEENHDQDLAKLQGELIQRLDLMSRLISPSPYQLWPNSIISWENKLNDWANLSALA
ncbi:hypothetical protein [Candidatus Similichlamydia epinepheli]|uniref:hypothetical protein n=1 Tax=Candidatus Similichlamydia epinepheli TaxID=1903953 RepID=UPI000D345084|nr:hypothetical protein [Candidatus Similichlamydia epinepheli]